MTPVRWGLMPIFWCTLVLALFVWLLPPCWPRIIGAISVFPIWVFVLAFFRNPTRTVQGDESTLVAPGEGVLVDIEEVNDETYINGPCVRFGIFLSVFNVHVNRSPVKGQVDFADYRHGKFLDVRHPSSSHANESNTIGITVDDSIAPGCKLLVRQLSGLIARRIICPTTVGDRLDRGQLYGMIRFGSRTELWIPKDWVGETLAQVGDKVKVGETPLCTLIKEQPS